MGNNTINANLAITLSKLSKLDFDFLIIGGLLCKAVLLDHARETNDIDIVFNTDLKRIEGLLRKEFAVIRFDYFPISDISTDESFAALVKINNEKILIEGRKVPYFNQIKKETYKIGDLTFEGVAKEFQIAEKIIAMFSIPVPLYKHLIDLYSFSFLDETIVDKKEIKKYFDLILSHMNEVKKKQKLPLIVPTKNIDSNKEFEGSLYLISLQSKYNYSKEYLINKINEWLSLIFI